MAFYSYIFSANYKRFATNLKRIAKEKHRSYLALTIDTYYSILKYGIGLSDYLNYKFYDRQKQERKEYVGIKMQNIFYEKVSPSAYKKRYTVKPNFLKEFHEYTKRDFFVPTENNFEDFKKFITKHEVFMSKPYDGLGGADVTKIYTKNIDDLKAFYEKLITNHLFLEELVIQHEKLNALCDTSVNTIRIMTFNDHNKPKILWAGLRIGNGINSVDNFHAGGMGAEIDLKTGTLIGPALDKDLKEFKVHPKSKVKIDGFEIPYFKEVQEMVKKAAKESDKILVVGWDVAITPDGPLIIEGNRRPGFDLVQVTSDRGRMDIIREVLKHVEK
ncbi:MAG: hypothetical protein HFI09_01010 [Bacilli bacterium]|nr:hypothetical protein [Bacilli bacterium]